MREKLRKQCSQGQIFLPFPSGEGRNGDPHPPTEESSLKRGSKGSSKKQRPVSHCLLGPVCRPWTCWFSHLCLLEQENKRSGGKMPGRGGGEVGSREHPPTQWLVIIRMCELLVDEWSTVKGSMGHLSSARPTEQNDGKWQGWCPEEAAGVLTDVGRRGPGGAGCLTAGNCQVRRLPGELLKGFSIWISTTEGPWWPVTVSRGSSHH